jgi:lysophospholipase L1-like esterase
MTPPNRLKAFLFNVLSFVVALTLSFMAAEGIVRLKNASMEDYNTEMWRYARELKFPSPDPRLGHEHVANAHAVLQSVDIRTNAWGLRGGPVSYTPAPGTRRILVLGSSIALGWGVDEDKVVSSLLQMKFAASGQNVEVLNGGIGNYNAERYVERFLTRLAPLQPTDLLILAFVRDGEELTQGGGNFLLRNSQLAVTAWTAINRVVVKSGEASLVDHYRQIYAPGSPALALMKAEFAKLAAYARQHRIRVTMAMVPDIHNLTNYPLGFVHAIFAQTARDNGFAYIDLLQTFQGLTPEEIWAMRGDPHPNARGHALMSDAIYGVLAQARETDGTH